MANIPLETLKGTFTIRSAAGILRQYAKQNDCDVADGLACKLTLALDDMPESACAEFALDYDETMAYHAAMAWIRD